MNSVESGESRGKMLALVIVVAIVAAVAVTVVQRLLFGESNVAVTGGAVGGIIGAMFVAQRRKRSTGADESV